MISKKIILGSAQFGQKYGITNNKSVSLNEIKKIIIYLRKKKIKFIDTAQGYGNSEKILGSFKLNKFKIITKINIKNKIDIEKLINISKKKLKVRKLYAVLIHDYQSLFEKDGKKIFKKLKDLKRKKLISRIGISIYNPEDFIKLKKKGFKFDIIQIPLSIFDKRFLKKDILKKIKKTGAEIHARSIFLQGLLLSNKIRIPIKLRKFENQFKKWNNFVKNSDLKPLDICLNYVLSRDFDKVIVGINNHKQFKEILNCKNRKIKIPESISTNKKFLINPYNWS